VKRQPTTDVTFRCTYGKCATQVSASIGSVLEMLNICQMCLEVRRALGLKAQREAKNA
jgi:hypothetical protein